MQSNTTIAAICTGHGGAIAVLRISGENTLNIVSKVFKPLKRLFIKGCSSEPHLQRFYR